MRLAAAACRRFPALAAAVLALACAIFVQGAYSAPATLVGSSSLSSGSDSNAAGSAEAFKAVASAGGSASQLSVYVDAGSTATTLHAGLYANGSGHPGALLGSGSATGLVAGAWNTVSLSSPVNVTAGTTYWIAVLAPTGTLKFRDVSGGGASETSKSSTLSALPSAWSTGTVYPDGQLSAYAAGGAVVDTTAPSTPTGLAASSVTQTSASLAWGASTDNVGVTGYDVLLNGVPLGTTPTLGYTLSSLVCGTAYSVAVAAHDAAGNASGPAVTQVVTLACPDTAAPSAPSGLSVSGVTQTGATLSWNASTDNVGVAGYHVYVGGSRAGTTASQSYAVGGLTCGTTYSLAVDAYDAAGNVSTRAATQVTTSACPDVSPPSVPSGLTATGVTRTSAALSWSASTDNVGVAGYDVYVEGLLVAKPTSTGFTLSNLSCGTSYTAGVDAYDAAGNVSAQATLRVTTADCPDTTAPSVPGGLAVSGVSQTGATLSWNSSTDNTGVTGYDVSRTGAASVTTTATSYVFSGLACGTTYVLAVDAYDAAGNVSAQATISVTTSACTDTTAPSAPGGLAVSGVTRTSATLSWNAATDNVGVTGYAVYVNGVAVGSTTTLTSYSLSGLACGTGYTLGVDAVDAAGNRSARSTTPLQTSACSDTTAPTVPPNERFTSITATSITLAWDASSDDVGVAGYRLYLNGTLVATTSSLSYTYGGLTCGTTYTVAITAFDAAGNASNPAYGTGTPTTSACAADTTAPSVPAGLAVSGVSTSGGTLSWTASSDNVGVSGYRLLLNSSAVGTTPSLSYAFSGLSCGTSYTVGVDAYDAAGNHSAAATATLVTSACPPPSGDTANLFVDSNGGTCTRSATATAYADSKACASFNAAYQAAQPGDIVKVQSGSYGSITIAQKSGAAAPNVVFQPAQGASVSFGTISTGDVNNNTPGGNYWTIQGPMTGHGADITLANHVTLDGLTLDGGYASNDVMYISAADSVTLSHMNICCSTDQKLIMTDAYRGPTTNLTITDSVLHDQTQTANTVHMECFFANGIQGLTIRRTIFRGCKSTGDMLITQSGTAPQPSNTLIENSIFETATDANGATVPYTIQTQTPNVLMPLNNFRFLYNLFQSPPDLQGGTGNPNAIVTGNIGAFTSCPAGTYSHNIWTAVKCGTTDLVSSGILGSSFFVSLATHDWHYTSSNPAINFGDPASYPATDLDNHARFTGNAPDAGPYEFGS